ncbi:hypothetical protein [Niabella drilacis]|nr:hypothetical protein [Niabella drilacis]
MACKKDKSAISPVTAAELTNYYVALERLDEDGKTKYRALYFENNNGTINATQDGAGGRRGQAVVIENNSFRFDLGEETNGTVTILLLTFEKQNNGKIILKSLTNEGTSSRQIVHAEMYATTSVPDWAGKTFSRKSGPASYAPYIKFSADKSMYVFASSTTELPQFPGYAIGRSVGFKDDRAPSKMFLFVPSWKGNAKENVLVDTAPVVATYGQE